MVADRQKVKSQNKTFDENVHIYMCMCMFAIFLVGVVAASVNVRFNFYPTFARTCNLDTTRTQWQSDVKDTKMKCTNGLKY